MILGEASDEALIDEGEALGTQVTWMFGGTVLAIVPEALAAEQISSSGCTVMANEYVEPTTNSVSLPGTGKPPFASMTPQLPVLPFTLKCSDAPLSRPDTRTFMPTYEPLAVLEVAVVVVPEDEFWEELVAAAYEGAETVRSSPQAQSVALPISAKSVLRVAIHLREVRRHAGRQGWRREMGGWVAVRALTFADRRGANFSVTETGWSLDLCPMRELQQAANRPKILRCRKCCHDIGLTAGTAMERSWLH